MTTLAKPIQGELNIPNIQGNYREIFLRFDFTDWPGVNSLYDFQKIRMEIKKTFSVKEMPFLVYEVDSGLTISDYYDTETETTMVGKQLSFILDEKFWNSQTSDWVYDINFLLGEQRYTLVEGEIPIDLTVGKL